MFSSVAYNHVDDESSKIPQSATSGTERSKDAKNEAASNAKRMGADHSISGDAPSAITRRVYHVFFKPQDSLGLAAFRILWGMMLIYEMYLFSRDDFKKMRIMFYSSAYRMPFRYMEWMVTPTIANMEIIVYIAFIAAVGISCGCAYRISTIVFTILFAFMFFLEASFYLNHFYLLLIITFTMIFVPANARMSVDSLLYPMRFFKSRVPAWNYLIFKSIVFVVYSWAVIVKLNVDWLRGEPLRHWLNPSVAEGFPQIQYFLGRWYAPYVMSYGGIIIDVLQPLLLIQSGWLNVVGFIITIAFHTSNKILMNIGLFPFMCIILSSLFSDVSWPRRFTFDDDQTKDDEYEYTLYVRQKNGVYSASIWNGKIGFRQWVVVGFFVLWIAFLSLSPARFLLRTTREQQPWDEIYHDFSWRMKLRTKDCDGLFFAKFGNDSYMVNPFQDKFMTLRQFKKSISDPWHVRYLGNALADLLRDNHPQHIRPEIYTDVMCSLNYRFPMPFVLPDVDLTSDAVSGPVESWVIPLPDLSPHFRDQYPWNWDWRGIINGTVDMQKVHEKWMSSTLFR